MSFSLPNFYERLKDLDPDISEMALRDLFEEIEKGSFSPSADEKKRVCTELLDCLSKRSQLALQGLAIKNLSELSPVLEEEQLQQIAESLMGYVCQTKKEELRDVSGMGLRSVIQLLNSDVTALAIIKHIKPKLMEGIKGDEPEITMECLSVVGELLRKYAGTLLVESHTELQNAIVPKLTVSSTATRKKAISCLGLLSTATSEEQFKELVINLAGNIKKPKKKSLLPTYISVLGALSKSVGFRLGKYVASEKLVGDLVKLLSDPEEDEEGEKDDIRVIVFNALSALIRRCPAEVRDDLNVIIERAIVFIGYDPSYFGDEDDDDDEDWSDEEDEEGWGEDNADESDMSWKVRKASVGVLRAIIITRPDLLASIVYPNVIPKVVNRFGERDDNVRQDVFGLFADTLNQSALVSDKDVITHLKGVIPSVVVSLSKELQKPNVTTETIAGIFLLLCRLVSVERNLLSEHVSTIIPVLVSIANGKDVDETVLTSLFSFLEELIHTHEATVIFEYTSSLADTQTNQLENVGYKITLAALRSLRAFITAIGGPSSSSFDASPFGPQLYSALWKTFSTETIDVEVKNCATRCIGGILSSQQLSSALSDKERTSALSLIIARVSNDFSTETAFETLILLASASNQNKKDDMFLSQLTPAIRALSLRISDKPVQRGALTTLAAILTSSGHRMEDGEQETLLKELSAHIGPGELDLSNLTLAAAQALLTSCSSPSHLTSIIKDSLYPNVLRLVKSSVLPAFAVEALMNFYGELVKLNIKGFGFDELLKSLLSSGRAALRSSASIKGSDTVIAQCVAAVCVGGEAGPRDNIVSDFIAEVKGKKKTAGRALLCLGEIGRRVDLGHHSKLASTVLRAMKRDTTAVAASYSLGNLTVGNVGVFLPLVLKELESHPESQTKCLRSLKETISRLDDTDKVNQFLPFLEKVLHVLVASTAVKEEETREAVAGCLGKLVQVAPDQALPGLVKLLKSESPFTRHTAVVAFKHSISTTEIPADSFIAPVVVDFVSLIDDSSKEVRLGALQALTYATNHKPAMVRPLVPTIQHPLYTASTFSEIEVVELGMVKHKIDHGEPIRKAAYECMYALVAECLDKLDLPALVNTLASGLKDKYDIAILVTLLIGRVARNAGAILVQGIESLIEPLSTIVGKELSEGASTSDISRHEEMVRTTLGAIATMSKIPDAETSVQFKEFLRTKIKSGPLEKKFDNIVRDLKK